MSLIITVDPLIDMRIPLQRDMKSRHLSSSLCSLGVRVQVSTAVMLKFDI